MFTHRNMECVCRCSERSRTHAILFNILSGGSESTDPRYSSSRHCCSDARRTIRLESRETCLAAAGVTSRCHCATRRTVRLESRETCLAAAGVLVKTVRFVASLPAFQQLPPEDRRALLHHCWAPLFILGLAQERVSFEVEHEPARNLLKNILLKREQTSGTSRDEPTLSAVHNLRACLRKLWSLDLSPKEYAYLKGTMIFNPDVPGLREAPLVDSLQREARRALTEVLFLLHSADGGGLERVVCAVSALHTVTPTLITQLFFTPIIGSADIQHLINDMLFAQ